MTLPRPAACLFDWDGFIVNSLAQIHNVFNTIMSEMGRDHVDLHTAIKMTGHGPRGSQEVLGFPEHEGEHFQRRLCDLFFRFTPTFELMPGAHELMAAIPADVPIGIVSNKEGNMLRQEIAHLGWENRISAVVGVGEAPANKPSPLPALQALKAMNIAPSRAVWFAGDTGSDMSCAQAAGLTSILVSGHEYHGPKPDFHYPDLHTLIQAMQ